MEFHGGTHMQRHCTLVFVFVLFSLITSAQSVRVDEHASQVTLKGSVYEVALVVSANQQVNQATVVLDVIDPLGVTVGKSSFSADLRQGTNRFKSRIALEHLPKKSAELLWYRLACSITANQAELGRDVLPLFGSVDDFVLHVSAPMLVQPAKKFFVRVHTNNPVLATPVGGVGIKVAVTTSDKGSGLVSGAGTTASNGYLVIPLTVPSSVDAHETVLTSGDTRIG
jgi:hypothetical protein